MRYAEIENELGFDPSEPESWPEGMRYAYVVLPSRNSALNFAAGVAYERRRAQAERAHEVAMATAALREGHPAIGA